MPKFRLGPFGRGERRAYRDRKGVAESGFPFDYDPVTPPNKPSIDRMPGDGVFGFAWDQTGWTPKAPKPQWPDYSDSD